MASSKKHERRRARESALALLYSSDITETDARQLVEEGRYPAEDFDFPEYAERLVLGVGEHADAIDGRLAATSENWALDRMPVVDRAVLRLAVYEMLYVDEVPVSVAINEAVELAKAFGGEDDSSRFVNGVLGRIARALESEAESADGAAETADAAAAGEAAAVASDARCAASEEPSAPGEEEAVHGCE